MVLEKMVPKDLIDAGVATEPEFVMNAVCAKHDKMKHNGSEGGSPVFPLPVLKSVISPRTLGDYY